jgi:hypothetical protein
MIAELVRGEVGENISEPAYCIKCGTVYQDLRKMYRIDGIDHNTGSYYGICGKCALKYSVFK